MNSKKLNIFIVSGVLFCYFVALTPLHYLWHSFEESFYSQKRDSKSHTQEHHSCLYCDLILSAEQPYLTASYSFDFNFIQYTLKEIFIDYSFIEKTFLLVGFSLRAPPTYLF